MSGESRAQICPSLPQQTRKAPQARRSLWPVPKVEASEAHIGQSHLTYGHRQSYRAQRNECKCKGVSVTHSGLCISEGLGNFWGRPRLGSGFGWAYVARSQEPWIQIFLLSFTPHVFLNKIPNFSDKSSVLSALTQNDSCLPTSQFHLILYIDNVWEEWLEMVRNTLQWDTHS